jgi:phosphoenolpyruvate---glycerone phosphotransferase subunit DhaL
VSITTAELAAFVRRFAVLVAEHRDELTRLDQAVGDGDHGINMDRGMRAVVEALPGLEGGDAGALFKGVGMKLISTVGGASGPLYGTLFLRLGTSLAGVTEVDPGRLAAAFRAGLEGVMQRGKAEPGDKTMVDALLPAVEALERGAGSDWQTALAAAADAAADARDRIIPLVARKGRASYLGDRSSGNPDPGATSTALLFTALREALASA